VTTQAADVTAPLTGVPEPAATPTQPGKTRYPPVPHPTFLRETTLEDAIAYRLARLAAPCPDCGNDPAANRCADHLGDLDLLVTYHKALQAAERESRTVERERREDPR
jgi:hypothetical protein